MLAGPTVLAATVEEDIGGVSGVFWDCYDVIVTAAAAGAAKRASNTHDGMIEGEVTSTRDKMNVKGVSEREGVCGYDAMSNDEVEMNLTVAEVRRLGRCVENAWEPSLAAHAAFICHMQLSHLLPMPFPRCPLPYNSFYCSGALQKTRIEQRNSSVLRVQISFGAVTGLRGHAQSQHSTTVPSSLTDNLDALFIFIVTSSNI